MNITWHCWHWARRGVGVLVVVAASGAEAATVQGTMSYDGISPRTVMPTLAYGVVGAYNFSLGTWTFGTVNLATDSYVVSGLAPGEYGIYVRLSDTVVSQAVLPVAGSLYGSVSVTLAGEETLTQPVELGYVVHLIQPLDAASAWVGGCGACSSGAEVPTTFTLAWKPVPHATSYTVTVRRWSCTSELATEQHTTAATTLAISQGTTDGEKFLLISVAGFGGAKLLTVMPYVAYTGCSWQVFAFHAPAAGGGRPIHPTDSRFIPQIAHLQGNPPSFWKADLFLTNPTSAAVRATLRFTPRDADGLVNYREAELDLPARASRVVRDVLDTLFHASGAGSLEVQPAALEVACRVYTPGAGPGLYGQGFVPIDSNGTAWLAGPSARLGTGGVFKGTFRSNLALVEVWGEPVTLRVVLLDRNGTVLGEKTVALKGFGNTQLNDVVGTLGGPSTLEEAQVEVEVLSGGGRVGAALSVVDNGSQDPSTFPLVRR